MKDTGRQRAIDVGAFEYVQEMLQLAGATRCNQRHRAECANSGQLLDIVAATDAIPVHAIQDDLAGATVDRFPDPGYGVSARERRFTRVPRILINAIAAVVVHAVHAQHDALGTESSCQPVDEFRIAQRRGIYGDLVGALVEHVFRVGDAADAARHAEGDVEEISNVADPATIDRAAIGAGRNVVEDEFVGALLTISPGKINDVADDAVLTEPDAFNDGTVANVEAGDYASRRNVRISSAVIFPSSNARPVIALAAPASRSAARSARFLIPPDACSCRSWYRASISR